MMSQEFRRSYELDCDEVARDAMDGKRVAVFCDGQTQATQHKNGIAAAARRAGAVKVVSPVRDRRVDIDGHAVRLFLANGLDGRGFSADVVYLSDSARMQHDYARLMGCTDVK